MRVLFFAHLKDVTGCAEIELDCTGVDAEGLWTVLLQRFPGLAPYRPTVRLARNARYVTADTRFESGDEVALIPPVSGG
ncbi:MoaD/ThiS family protein [Limisphaera ngatamarikiensis]|uniref:Molybdopterin synthase sulfur carrier subunit n=1 Tax=Limisphaera ngatamarikiensis TaxID=1324935 RepID=A0A6M1RSP3_9BACT|nr:MoaD/ThiS family protein [Limisphaera ngatamarikiensis]NGO39645.1 MoaD/ThiS family protein [Limisphaera ngatamarikiensis]